MDYARQRVALEADMIYVVRTGRSIFGKGKEFVAWAVRVRDYWTKHFPEVKQMEVCRPASGERGSVTWFLKFESLAAWERTDSKANEDAGYQKLVDERLAFMEGPVTDTYYNIRP